jgi:hypothetical protein
MNYIKNSILLPNFLFITNILLFYYFGSIPGYLKYILNTEESMSLILDYSPIIIVPPILIIWQIYNIYKWNKANINE